MAAKWSVGLVVKDHIDTFVDERTTHRSVPDYLVFFGFPAACGAGSYVLDFSLADVDGVIAGVAIFTGLLFALVIHVFTLGLRITDDPRISKTGRIGRMIDQLEANVLYSVLVGIASTVTLIIAASTTSAKAGVGPIMTAVCVAVLVHLLLTMLMILKRMRSAYREFRR